MKILFCMAIWITTGLLCCAQDYIKPIRFDTITCKIYQEDSTWIYYKASRTAKVRRYKKSDIEFFIYFGQKFVLHPNPGSVAVTLTAKVKPKKQISYHHSLLAVADKLNNQAGVLEAGALVLAICGYIGMSAGILTLLIENNPASFMNGAFIITTSYLLGGTAKSKKNKANRILLRESSAYAMPQRPELVADTTSQ